MDAYQQRVDELAGEIDRTTAELPARRIASADRGDVEAVLELAYDHDGVCMDEGHSEAVDRGIKLIRRAVDG